MVDDISDGTWTFYDSWVAFPHNRVMERGSNIVGEIMISLDAPDGGTYGEFSIRFHRFRDSSPAARLEVFGDAWTALAQSGLVPALAMLPDGSPEGIRRMLLDLGYRDKTIELRGRHPAYCPTCNGKGMLDDIEVASRQGE